MTGLKGYSEVRAPDVGIAWYSLTRGCLIVVAVGEESKHSWYATYAEGEPEFEAARSYLFASMHEAAGA